MSLRGFLIVIVCRARNINTEAAFANWLASKQGALFSLIYFFGSFCVYYIPRNYVIPQTMPHAIPQTHSSFYPYRTTDHSVWQVRRLVAATRCGDTSKRQIASCVLENFCENLCLCNRNLSQKFCLIWFFFATCYYDKILLRRQKFSLQYTRSDFSDMLLQFVHWCVPTSLVLFLIRPSRIQGFVKYMQISWKKAWVCS